MRKSVILITGINGEIGHGLVDTLALNNQNDILGLDLVMADEAIRDNIYESIIGNILDKNLLDRINAEYEISAIYHLAAILSTRAEFSPMTAHNVNVDGTLNMLHLAMEQAISLGRPVKFFFPSSIAAYGIPNLTEKNNAGSVTEDQYRYPQTIYGCNKLYCENVGNYFAKYFKRLSVKSSEGLVDFRSIRFPGIVSATTLPSGGTSDYAPEMIHAAATGEPYSCFVRKDTKIPFLTMEDAIRAILLLMNTPKDSLSQIVYNISAFNPSAEEIYKKILTFFPDAVVDFIVNDNRQNIVDSWPAYLDESAAKNDWGWRPKYDFDSAFEEYLIPEIKKRYNK